MSLTVGKSKHENFLFLSHNMNIANRKMLKSAAKCV